MEKRFKYNRFSLFALALVAMFTFSACGDENDDDNDNNGNNSCNCDNKTDGQINTVDKPVTVAESDVIANWKCIEQKGYAVSKGESLEYNWMDDITDNYYLFFNADGFYYSIDSYNNVTKKSVAGSWKYTNGYIYIYDDFHTNIFTIISYSDTKMIIRNRRGDETAGEYYDYTLVKVNESVDEHVNQKNSQQGKKKSLEFEAVSGKEYKFSNEALGIEGTLKVLTTSVTNDSKRVTFDITTNDGRGPIQFSLGDGASDCSFLMWNGTEFSAAFQRDAVTNPNMVVMCMEMGSSQITIISPTKRTILQNTGYATDTYFWQE